MSLDETFRLQTAAIQELSHVVATCECPGNQKTRAFGGLVRLGDCFRGAVSALKNKERN